MPANLEHSAVITGLEKVSFHSNTKACSNYCTIALILHTSKFMLKILQARLQPYMKRELPDVQTGKSEESEIKLPTFVGSLKKQGNSNKISTSASLTMLKPLCVLQQTVENS